MLCPNCKTENLITSERQNIQIDHCPRCQGVWLDRGELEKLIQMTSPPSDGRQPEGYNGREIGEDEEASRKRGYSEKSDEDDDDDDERGGERRQPYRADDRDNDSDDRNIGRGDSYRSRDRNDDQGGESPVKSILREIFENLGNRLPRA